MTITATSSTDAILDALNAYDDTHDHGSTEHGTINNIWQDLILPMGIDEDATDDLGDQNEAFVLPDGRMFAWTPGQFGGWKQEACSE